MWVCTYVGMYVSKSIDTAPGVSMSRVHGMLLRCFVQRTQIVSTQSVGGHIGLIMLEPDHRAKSMYTGATLKVEEGEGA